MSSIDFGTDPKADDLTKREYFAAKAMEGYLSSNPKWDVDVDNPVQFVAKISVHFADELIKELDK